MIEKYISLFIEKVKNDDINEEHMIKIYEIFKRHKLSESEIEWAKNIATRIKNGELTKDMLIAKSKKWLSERSK